MKEKTINNIKTLFKSATDNNILFERRKNSFLAPLIIFVLTIIMMIVPQYLSYTNIKSETLIKNFPSLKEPMKELLTSSLDCEVKNHTLICKEDTIQINKVVGEDIKYTIIANQNSFTTDTSVSYSSPKNTDNLIILLKNYIKIRYCQRDHVNQKVITYEILGDYSKMEGYNFKTISQKLLADPSLFDKELSNFVINTYTSTLDTQLLVNISNSLLSFTLFVLVTSVIIKWPTLFRRKKGFKFSECIKISLTSALPAVIIASVAHFISNVDFTMTFALIYIARILYIYFKYISSKNNNILNKIYLETNDERFKI